MQPEHDPFCDESHNPRQRCNDALGPAPVSAPEPGAAFDVDPVEPSDEPASASEAAEPPPSSAVREAVAIAGTPQPTPYVTREWERTAAAVEGAAIDGEFGVEQEARRPGSAKGLAVVVLALVAAWLVARALRSRSRE